ncbi:hypothetical protein DPEC_G00114300 [Dallia pectoralis]|uniref:Uncharacterized protein n=1 Tax=Dallia pectoralis TaxID=75939 RepID=A0ACC2GTN5_DALPE|nr:hypothetical protein DPEC_G00114300 [Dallia pectoralis]
MHVIRFIQLANLWHLGAEHIPNVRFYAQSGGTTGSDVAENVVDRGTLRAGAKQLRESR